MSGTPTPTTPTVEQQVLALLSALLAQLEGDGIAVVSAPLLNAVNSILANSTGLNILGQVQALIPALIASALGQQQAVIQQVFGTIKQILLLLPQLIPTPAAPSAK